MNVEDQLRDYKATLDAASEEAADAPLPRGVVPIRIRPVRTLAIAAVAVAATIAIAFAAVGVSHKSSVSPAGVTTSTPTSASSPITAGPARVPNVVGMKSTDAATVLAESGYRVMRVDTSSCSSPNGIVVSQQPPAGARVSANSTATVRVCTPSTTETPVTVPVVSCPTEVGTAPSPSDPSAPKTLTINKLFAFPDIAGYSDRLGRFPITAPEGWNCKAIDATDGGVGVGVTPPGVTPRDTWGEGGTVTQPPADGVFAQSDGACQGCIYGDVCSIVPTAAADFPDYASTAGFCHPAPAGQHVTALGNNVYRIDDPAGTLGPDAARSVLRYTPKTATTDATEARVTCILPASQSGVCSVVLARFLAMNTAGS